MEKRNRHGQHHEDLVGFSGYITPELKAIAQVTANELEITMMSLFRNSIINEATRMGIVKNGQVVDKYKSTINAYVELYRAKKILKKENNNA